MKIDHENFYSFELPSVEGIKSLQFVLNVIQGEACLLMSQTIKYPRMNDIDENNDLEFSLYSTLELLGNDLKVGTYYIAVHGFASTDYSIGVAVSRIKNSTNTT